MCLMIRIQEGNNDPTKKLACLKGTEHEIAFCQFHNVQYDDYGFFYRNLHMRKKYSWRISKYVYFLGAYPQVRLNTFGVFSGYHKTAKQALKFRISRLIIEQYDKKNFGSSLSLLDRFY